MTGPEPVERCLLCRTTYVGTRAADAILVHIALAHTPPDVAQNGSVPGLVSD